LILIKQLAVMAWDQLTSRIILRGADRQVTRSLSAVVPLGLYLAASACATPTYSGRSPTDDHVGNAMQQPFREVSFMREDSPSAVFLACVMRERRPELQLLRVSAFGVRRDKAALSSGCKPHPAKCSSRKRSEQTGR